MMKKHPTGWTDLQSQQVHCGCVRPSCGWGIRLFNSWSQRRACVRQTCVMEVEAKCAKAASAKWVQVGGRASPPPHSPAVDHCCRACVNVCVFVCESYHAVHCKVLVLGLQLHGVGVVVADLGVARQEQSLVVHDPVKHLMRLGGGRRGVRYR